MPEIREIAAIESTQRALNDRVRDARILVDDLTREQKKADRDVEQVRTRRERDRGRIEQGLISNPKDLQRMNHELESLDRRITDLEDAELEVMEKLEEAQAELVRSEAEEAGVVEKLAALAATRDEKAGETGVALKAAIAAREAAVVGLPEDLLGLYERIREKQGVGAAALRARQCGGCNMRLNAADLGVIAKAPVDDVVRCEECSRILVRTSESGL
ncbi:C4-type zinc ribbon domain-containing protein [Nocardioides sp. JQ2195]|uniref:zinc ribbon domain-containing protein n=1 Tax=Nocardioides sp. JQ2195 TaxID=2592334 RepID=UPI001F102CA7|nr:C4-type zinc ribbon domain-containing protein [Nocardioides sp. JQ2195]